MSDWAEFQSWKHECCKKIMVYETTNTELTDDLILFLSDVRVYEEYKIWKILYMAYERKLAGS